MSARYAIYLAPAHGSPWWTFGAHWLGRDECNGAALGQPPLAQITPSELRALTAPPRRYGFHATLKAPFRLRHGHSVEDLTECVQALASTLKPLPLGPLQAVLLGDFVALAPASVPDELSTLAATCVISLDALRAPLSKTELACRLASPLDAREQELLQRYGYPHVLDRFRLHFTLSGPVARPTAQRLIQAVADPVRHLNASASLVLDRLCLFVEPAPGQPFKRLLDAVLHA